MFFQHIWNSVLFSNEFCWTWLESFSQINKFLALWFRISRLFLILSLFSQKVICYCLHEIHTVTYAFFQKKTGILSAWHFTLKILIIYNFVPLPIERGKLESQLLAEASLHLKKNLHFNPKHICSLYYGGKKSKTLQNTYVMHCVVMVIFSPPQFLLSVWSPNFCNFKFPARILPSIFDEKFLFCFYFQNFGKVKKN